MNYLRMAEIGRKIMAERRDIIEATAKAYTVCVSLRRWFPPWRSMDVIMAEYGGDTLVRAYSHAAADLENEGRNPEYIDAIVCARYEG